MTGGCYELFNLIERKISVLFYILDVPIGLENNGDVCGHVNDVYAHCCKGRVWKDASQCARRLEETLDFL